MLTTWSFLFAAESDHGFDFSDEKQRSSSHAALEPIPLGLNIKFYVIFKYWFRLDFNPQPKVEELFLCNTNLLSLFFSVSSNLNNHQYNLR